MSTPAENKSKKDLFRERIGQKYADSGLNLDDEEEFYGRVNDDYDDYESRLADSDARIKGYEENEAKIGKMISDDPRSAAFFNAWSGGGHPVVEMIRRYGPEILDAASAPELLNDIEAASKEYNDMVAQGKAMSEEYDENFASSIEQWKQFAMDNGLSEDEAANAVQEYAQAMSDFEQGNFTPENVMRFRKGGTYDNDVAAARYEGEVEGKNAKIEEKMKKDNKKRNSPSNLGGGGAAPAPQRKRPAGAVGSIASRKSIWDTGK